MGKLDNSEGRRTEVKSQKKTEIEMVKNSVKIKRKEKLDTGMKLATPKNKLVVKLLPTTIHK